MGSLEGLPETRPQFADLLLRSASPFRCRRILGVGFAVVVLHIYLLALFLPTEVEDSTSLEREVALVNIEDIDDISNYNLNRIENVTVGILNAPDGPSLIIPPPPGFGGNTGSGGGIDVTMLQAVTRASEDGNSRSDATVNLGLQWLARHQAPTGRWGINDFSKYTGCNCAGCGLEKDPAAATALALLPFLAAGETHKGTGRNHRHQPIVDRGLRFLLQQQRDDGSFGGPFANALATLALCEAYGLTADPALKQPAQRAADCIAGSQRQAGGWAASSYEPPDLEITGWHVLALKSATFAGFSVPNLTWSEVTAYFDSVGSADGSYYGSRALTPIALHCRMELGWTRRHPGLNRGVERLTEDTPGVRRESIVTLYHAHNVVHHFRHREDQWTEQVRDLLVSRQDLGSIACQKGSWKPGDDWTGKKLGRLGTTALSLLILEPRVRMLSYMNPYRPGLMKDEAIRDAVK